MTSAAPRPLPRAMAQRHAWRGAALALALAALPGCGAYDQLTGRREPARIVVPPPAPAGQQYAAAPLPPPQPGQVRRGPGGAALPPPVPQPGVSYVSPPPTPAQREQAALVATCREQAEQTILQRDRGQLLREDEQAARVGASTSLNDYRYNSDRLGRIYARDRLAEDCVDANRPLPPRAGGAR